MNARLTTLCCLVLLAGALLAEAPLERTLPSGTRIAVAGSGASRIFAVHVLLRNRSAAEPAGKEGLTDLAHRFLGEGTARRTRSELTLALNGIGAQLKTVDSPMIPFDDYYSVPEYSWVRFQVIDTYRQEGLRLLAEILFEPRLDTENLQRVKAALFRVQGRREKDPRAAGQEQLFGLLFQTPWMNRSIYGTHGSVESITIEDVRGFWPTYFSAANMIWTVSTNRPAAETMDEVAGLLARCRPAPPTSRTPIIPAAAAAGRHRTLTLKSRQGYLWAGRVFPVADSDWPALEVLVAMFSDQLAFELRERQGLAYSLGAGVGAVDGGRLAAVTVSMGTRQANLDTAAAGIREQMARFAQAEFTPRQLAKTVNRLKGQILMRNFPALNRSYFMALGILQDRPPDYHRRRLDRLGAVGLEDLRRVRDAYFHPDAFAWVRVE